MKGRNDTSLQKYYILQRPSRLSDISFDDLDDGADARWMKKAKDLQARRWREIRRQQT